MKTTVNFQVELEHDESLDPEELQTKFIEPVREGIRTAAVLGPDGLRTWKATTTSPRQDLPITP